MNALRHSTTPIVQVDGITKSYWAGSTQHPVLTGVNFELRRGEVTSLIGRSGSGKSTLISLLAGLMRPDTGHVIVDGQETDALDDTGRAAMRAERIGVVLQSDNLIPFLTAVENVEMAMAFRTSDRSPERAHQLLRELGLRDRLHHYPRQLSGGEAQRVAVAVALANEPDLLLADEVVGQLDSATSMQVANLIFAASHERALAVLFVTHDEELARRAQQRLRLSDGEVVAA